MSIAVKASFACATTFVVGALCAGNVNAHPAVMAPLRGIAPLTARVEVQLYAFAGKPDGSVPVGGVVADASGHLYGFTNSGGPRDDGTVYELTPTTSGYTEAVLYTFHGGNDGRGPIGVPVLEKDGTLYGVTQYDGGGASGGCGTAFKVELHAGVYQESTLFHFDCLATGATPQAGLVRDPSGALLGTTYAGGANGFGTIFKLVHGIGGYSETVLHDFQGGADGAWPAAALTAGSDGVFYGSTLGGGPANAGTVFSIGTASSSFTETVLYTFLGGTDGTQPHAPLLRGSKGVLYGTTQAGGNRGGGTVFSLTPRHGAYIERIIHVFSGTQLSLPSGGLLADGEGNFYGTTEFGGTNGWGAVYELKPNGSGYKISNLYNFQGLADGGAPVCTLIAGLNGNLYGTSQRAQQPTNGNVFAIEP